MAETKLKKVNARLYHEPYKDDRPFKWAKRLKFLPCDLTDIQVVLGLVIGRPETYSHLGLDEDSENDVNNDVNAEQGGTTTSGEEEAEEKYGEDFGWTIRATGCLEDRIGLIREDGIITARTENFDRVDIILRPISESDKEKACGTLFYSDAQSERRAGPYLYLDLLVPEPRLKQLCDEFVTGRLFELKLGAYVDVFQSEVDHSLWQPPMRQHFYIEEDEVYNRAYLSFLHASRSITTVAPGTVGDHPDEPRKLLETEDFSEQKVSGFKNAWNQFSNIVVIAAVIYLVWKLLDRYWH